MLKEKFFPSYLVGRDRVIIVRWCGADLQGRPSKQAVLPRPSKYYIEVSTVFCPAANHLISWPTSSESRDDGATHRDNYSLPISMALTRLEISRNCLVVNSMGSSSSFALGSLGIGQIQAEELWERETVVA